MIDFKNGQELLEVCKKKQCSISEVMKQREIEGTSSTKKEVEDKMRKALAIMKEAVRKPLEDPKPSMSGLIGGEAKQITGYRESGTNVCGTFMNKLIAYSMAVLEVNASMGVIVAAPTAGSSGVVPGVLLALQEEKGFGDEQMTDALFHTAAIGYLLMRNASVAGAEAGCQVYNNISEQAASSQAVDATRGMIILSDGKPIEAYFFSTSWGCTDTDEVWNAKKSASYLRSIAVSHKAVETMVNGILQPEMTEQSFRERILQRDAGDYEKEDVWYRWKVCIPWEMLKERSERKWPQLGAFTGLSIQGRNPGGGVKTLEIQGENQNATLENEYAIRKFLSIKGLSVSRNDGSVCDTMELLPSACFIVDFRKEQGAGTFVFTGGGYGHGVGMSQNGAKHLAENGLGWRDILQIFYQNITIENLQEY